MEGFQQTRIPPLELRPLVGAVHLACIANQISIQRPSLLLLSVILVMKSFTGLTGGVKVRLQITHALASLMDFMDLPVRNV